MKRLAYKKIKISSTLVNLLVLVLFSISLPIFIASVGQNQTNRSFAAECPAGQVWYSYNPPQNICIHQCSFPNKWTSGYCDSAIECDQTVNGYPKCQCTLGYCAVAPSPTPVNNIPRGTLDIADCNNFQGWAVDMDVPSTSIHVHVYINGPAGGGGTFVGQYATTVLRPGVNSSLGITGNHGFVIATPNIFINGISHSVYIYAIDNKNQNNPILSGAPKTVFCPLPTNTPIPTNTPTRIPTAVPTQTPYPTYTPYPSLAQQVVSSSTPRSTVARTPTPKHTPTAGGPSLTPIKLATPTQSFLVGPTHNQNSATPFVWPTSGDFVSIDSTGSIPILIVDPFTNDNNEVGPKFTLNGKSQPFATIELSFSPDGITNTVKSDTNGLWKYTLNSPLSDGPKQLRIRATTPDGGQNTVTIPFTVVKKSFLGILFWSLLLLVVIGVASYIKKKISETRNIPPKLSGGPGSASTQTQEKRSPQ